MSPSIRRLWWLNPAWLFAVVIGGTMLAAALQGTYGYQLYGAHKYVGGQHVLLAALAILVFASGAWLATAIGGEIKATLPKSLRIVRIWFWLMFGLVIFGYTVWVGEGFLHGLSLGMLRDLIANPDSISEDAIRNELFPTIPGITTCVQFGVPAVLLGMWLYIHGDRRVLWPMALIAALATIRALVWGERLATIELIVPAFVIWLRSRVLVRSLSSQVGAALQLAPVLGILLLLLFFGSAEYFRSYQDYRDDFNSISEFTWWRFSGYYTTCHNNGAMAMATQPPLPLPFWTIRPLWEFPGMENAPFSYYALTGVDPIAARVSMLEHYGVPDLNNEGGLFMPLIDFGVVGFTVFWFSFGFVAGRVYRYFLAGTLAGLTMYPLFFVAILETPRLLYLSYTRAFPALVALLVVLWLTRRAVPRPSSHIMAGIQGPVWSAIGSSQPPVRESRGGYQSW
jgi:oligosaccharide repeat unit polymerase